MYNLTEVVLCILLYAANIKNCFRDNGIFFANETEKYVLGFTYLIRK